MILRLWLNFLLTRKWSFGQKSSHYKTPEVKVVVKVRIVLQVLQVRCV